NFGQFWDGPGGYWINVTETTMVRLTSKANPGVYLDYTIVYNEPVRTGNLLSASETTFTAGAGGEIGIPLPMIDGDYPRGNDIDKFVFEKKVNGNWVELSDFAASGFSYQANGYNSLSANDQWGYWIDYIYGIWFQPIQVDMEIRVGYPTNGAVGGPINDNYVTYQFIGNPNAVRPDVSDLGNIELGTSTDADLADWEMIWNDEFSGTTLDRSKWNFDPGYYLNDDPGTWGWGNAELEYYTESSDNIFVENGNLNLRALSDPKTFPQDPDRVAPYSSGKVVSRGNFSFKYGRIDFRAKLPSGDGLWPALWLLPTDDTYGTWAASGEIDVMEARGRLPGATSGALHFGGQWPANTNIGADYSFADGGRFDTDYHVYSAVWEDDNIKWYVDGNCFFKATSAQWYSLADGGNDLAPFDQEFFIIMNLAAGGWFDGGITPDPNAFPATMQVDYVRVYQAEGSTDGSYTNNGGSGIDIPGPQDPTEPVDLVELGTGKAVTASGSENIVFIPESVNDDDLGTRWASDFTDDAWLVMDLAEVNTVSKVVLNWETSYAAKYEIYTSVDGVNYTKVYTQNNGQGGVETIDLTPVAARYVKFQGVERALPYGYSLWEMDVFGVTE
ncbi:MAG: family 16 glycosylhydrolase, partial [Lachnospiraceae bacterium]|nr:family 16 glycosylhydrolase [Lachnospiraceae bacterium]